jgi:hypothetical protein
MIVMVIGFVFAHAFFPDADNDQNTATATNNWQTNHKEKV